MIFAARLMLGDTADAEKLILGSVSQSEQQPAIPGKDSVQPDDFLKAVSACPILQIKNLALSSMTYREPADLILVWDCQSRALLARVKTAGNSVEVSEFKQQPFVPPAPPPATSKKDSDN